MAVRRYLPEDDALIRAAFAHPWHSAARAEALAATAVALRRTVDALRARHAAIEIRAGHQVTRHRAFGAAEDDALAVLPERPSLAQWTDLARRFGRSTNALRHRRQYLAYAREEMTRQRVVEDARRVPLPVAQPAWFERPLTRERLMAGR